MDSITITIPKINPETITALETAQTQEHETVVQALAAIREKYSPFAKHNGFVKIAATYRGDGTNWREEKDYYYERDGKKVRALLALDDFSTRNSSQNHGRVCGTRLYLLASGEWLMIERDGNWSAWQGAPESWSCGDGIINTEIADSFEDCENNCGSIRIVTDAQVESEFDLADILKKLADSLTTMSEKLADRLVKVKQRTAIAAQLLAAICK